MREASALRSGGVVVFRWRWRTGVVKDDDDDDAGDDGSTSEKKKSCANRKSHVSYSAPGDRGTSNSPVSARGRSVVPTRFDAGTNIPPDRQNPRDR